MDSFYHEVLADLLARQTLSRQTKLLVLCGGKADRCPWLKCEGQSVVVNQAWLKERYGPVARD